MRNADWNNGEMQVVTLQTKQQGPAISRGGRPQIVQAEHHLPRDHRQVVYMGPMNVDPTKNVRLGPNHIPLERPRPKSPLVTEHFRQGPATIRESRQGLNFHAIGNGDAIT